jgi:sporulation protein YlmC with PRC-barrel domain
MKGLHLVHDVQDAQLHDRKKENIGRVDGLVLELREGRPLRVTTILVGGPVRDERIGGPILWLMQLLRRVVGMKSEGISRIPFSAVREISHCVVVDVDEETLESEHVERWLCDHVVRRIPGSRGAEK